MTKYNTEVTQNTTETQQNFYKNYTKIIQKFKNDKITKKLLRYDLNMRQNSIKSTKMFKK